jgi:hypothetical protein
MNLAEGHSERQLEAALVNNVRSFLLEIGCDLLLSGISTRKTSSMPIGVSTYTTTAKLPKDYKNLLPDNKIISQKLYQLFQGEVVTNEK